MTNSQTPATAFPPLPVRRRDVLETFDTAIKLYRRYYVVLLAWAAMVHVAPALLGVGIVYLVPDLLPIYQICAFCVQIFVQPVLIGAVACCIAAAVRGQTVTFRQCWTFFRPRYWPTVGQYLMTRFLAGIGWCALFFGLTMVWLLLVWGVTAVFPLPLFLTVLGSITFLVISLAVVSVIGSVLSASMMVTPIVVCLEDDKRGGEAQTRAWQLFKGNWLRITWLYSLIGLAFLSTLGIVMGMWGLWDGIGGMRQAMNGLANNPATAVSFAAVLSFGTMICTPLIYLCSAVLYLDLRVRREALDLEWSAHVSAPPRGDLEQGAPYPAAPKLPSGTGASAPGASETPSFGGSAQPEPVTRPQFEELPPVVAARTDSFLSEPLEGRAWEPPVPLEVPAEFVPPAAEPGTSAAFAPPTPIPATSDPNPPEPSVPAPAPPLEPAPWTPEPVPAALEVPVAAPVPVPPPVEQPEPVPAPAEIFVPVPPAPQTAPRPAAAPVPLAPAPQTPAPASRPQSEDEGFNPSSFG